MSQITDLQDYADAAVATHAAEVTSVHGAGVDGKVAVIHGGGENIFVQETAPTALHDGDLWFDTSGS